MLSITLRAWAGLPTFVVALSLSAPGLAAKRVALIIGNSSYQSVARLANPANDAKLMADALSSLGFTLIGGGPQLDLGKIAMDRVVQSFGTQLLGADVALFYYAGHGVQVRGSNYLVPISANPTREADVDFQMLDVNLVLRQMEASGTRLNLVILDACRNNPFSGRGLRATVGGLAQMQAAEGTLISYATQPGNIAQDGADGNSPFTKALAQAIHRPGINVFETFNDVGLAVKRATGGAQQPWVSSSPIDGSFYFAGQPTTTDAPKLGPAEQTSANSPTFDVRALELSFWETVRASTSVAVVRTYLDRYPNGIFVALAHARIQELEDQGRASEARRKQEEPRQKLAARTDSTGLIPRTIQQPSKGVDCMRPGEPIEYLICADGELSEWDGILGQAFNRKMNRAIDKLATRQEERDWIERRYRQCNIPKKGTWSISDLAPSKGCILQMTKERINELNAN